MLRPGDLTKHSEALASASARAKDVEKIVDSFLQAGTPMSDGRYEMTLEGRELIENPMVAEALQAIYHPHWHLQIVTPVLIDNDEEKPGTFIQLFPRS